jgi:predicted RNA-binding Zn-ribbon protein involved in translation (DUF1610 family)
MDEVNEKKGTKGYRFLMVLLYAVLGLLLFWFLGFMMNDIGNQPGPSLTEIQKSIQDPVLVKDKERLNNQLKQRINTIDERHQQQTILQTSITSYRDTMNQLLDLQKASIQKGMTLSPESQKNLQNVTDLYLDYQKQFQDLNNAITADNLQVQQFKNQIKEIDEKLTLQNEKANLEYSNQWVKHNWAMAGLQLLILIPLLLITAFLFKKYRKSVYKSMILTAGIAIFLKIALVMHDYFPSYLFKYLLILALIYTTIRVLLSMLRMMTAPKPAWLQKQYREGYDKAQCPTCQFSIKPSISKFFYPEKKGNFLVPDYTYLNAVTDYTCPSCGEVLFEKCGNCSHPRYALLHYCDTCGVKKEST